MLLGVVGILRRPARIPSVVVSIVVRRLYWSPEASPFDASHREAVCPGLAPWATSAFSVRSSSVDSSAETALTASARVGPYRSSTPVGRPA